MRRIAIVGSRNYPDMDAVRLYIDGLDPEKVMVVSGGARGVDTVAERHAAGLGIHTAVIKALWGHYGKLAGYKRNPLIVDLADEVVAFQHNNSRGTQHTIEDVHAKGKPVTLFTSSNSECNAHICCKHDPSVECKRVAFGKMM